MGPDSHAQAVVSTSSTFNVLYTYSGMWDAHFADRLVCALTLTRCVASFSLSGIISGSSLETGMEHLAGYAKSDRNDNISRTCSHIFEPNWGGTSGPVLNGQQQVAATSLETTPAATWLTYTGQPQLFLHRNGESRFWVL